MPRNRTGASAGRRPHPAPSIRSPLRRRFRRGAIQPRIRVMGAILGTVLLLFAARLVQIQGFNADDYAEAAASLRLTTIEIPTVRGDITDMAGRPFAMSVEVRTVFLDPAEVRDDQREEIVQELSRRFDLPPEEIVAKLNARVDGRPSRYEVVQRGVPIEEWKEIRELGFHGVSAERDYKRVYPDRSKERSSTLSPRGQPASSRLGPPYDTSDVSWPGPLRAGGFRSMSAHTVNPSSGLPCTPMVRASLDTVSRP